jgi:hypothetical protein
MVSRTALWPRAKGYKSPAFIRHAARPQQPSAKRIANRPAGFDTGGLTD